MTVIEFVNAHRAEYSASELVGWANLPSIERRNSERITVAGLAKRFGTPTVQSWKNALSAAGLDVVWETLLAGVDFSDDQTQGELIALTPVLGSDAIDQLTRLGRWTLSPWQAVAGDSAAPITLAEVQSALDRLETQDEVARRYAGAMNACQSGASRDEVLAILAGVENS